MSRPIINDILTMSNNAINKTLTTLRIILLEQNTLGPINLIQTILWEQTILFYIKMKIQKEEEEEKKRMFMPIKFYIRKQDLIY